MEIIIDLEEKQKIKAFIEEARKEYDLEVVNQMSKSNYDRALKNFELKLEKMCSSEYQEECFQRLQKNKNQELFEGAYTRKEFLKVYFYNSENNWIVQYNLRYKVTGKRELKLILTEEVSQKNNVGAYVKVN